MDQWDSPLLLTAFVACAAIIAIAGTRLTAIADQLADRGGFGEALTGAVLLGAVTSLSGSVLSVSAAWQGDADLALSNAYGGIAVQTFFLAIADISYRRANLEHAAASAQNMLQSALLVCLLAVLLVAGFTPQWTLLGVHPATLVLLAGYGYGIHLSRRMRDQPMWHPQRTRETREDFAEPEHRRLSLFKLVSSFVALGLLLAITGWWLEAVASALVQRSGISVLVVGTLFTSLATSLPELVTTLAAVRRGALTLAFGGIIGGNAYDTLFAAFSDIAYRSGSIYHSSNTLLQSWLAFSILMSGILIIGMLVREKRGLANIGFESVLIILCYFCAVAVLVTRAA